MTRRLPTPTSLQALIDSVRALHQKPRDRRLPDPTVLAAIERRLLRAVTRDRTGTTDRDGYPTTTLGGFGSGNGSSVESHALARPERDRHHELTLLALEQLDRMVMFKDNLLLTLDAIDALTSDQGPAPRTCAACTGHRPLGGDQAVRHRGTVGDRLEREVDLCRACMDFVRTTAEAGQRTGRLPSTDEVLWHDNHGRWRLRLSQISKAG